VLVTSVAIVVLSVVAVVLGRIGPARTASLHFVAGSAPITEPASEDELAPAPDQADAAPVVVPANAIATTARSRPVVLREAIVAGSPAAVVESRSAPKPAEQLIFDGQSFNYYPGNGKRAYPAQLLDLMGPRIGISAVVGISGTSYAYRSATVGARVDSLYPRARRTTVLDIAGQNEILGGTTATELFRTVAAYADARHQAGAAFVVEYTITKSDRYTSTQEAERAAYNRLLMGNAGHHIDAVVDIASRPEFANPSNTTYFEDGIHPTEAGARIIAAMAQATVRYLLG
jgi:hypothetical protein